MTPEKLELTVLRNTKVAAELPLLVTKPPPLVPSLSERMVCVLPPRSSVLPEETKIGELGLNAFCTPPTNVLALVPSPTVVAPE